MIPAGNSADVQKITPRLRAQRILVSNPQLFEDTSLQQPGPGYPPGVDYQDPVKPSFGQSAGFGPGSHDSHTHMTFPGQEMLADPVANVAMQYGQSLAGQGTEYMHRNVEKYIAASKLKYYFAVDTAYVGKKLGLIVFPYAHTDWSLRYGPEEPVAPRYDTNAPDLYIPVMSFVTYILLAGIILGTRSRFSPEQLGVIASTALIWTTIEILALWFFTYVMNASTHLRFLDLLSFCGYKYVGMIVILLASLAFSSVGYYVGLCWMSCAVAFFLARSLHMVVMVQTDSESFSRGNKRRLYALLVFALSQPLLMWWMTHFLAVVSVN